MSRLLAACRGRRASVAAAVVTALGAVAIGDAPPAPGSAGAAAHRQSAPRAPKKRATAARPPSVRELRRRLVAAGCASGAGDGRYGRVTPATIDRFQADDRRAAGTIAGQLSHPASSRSGVLRLGTGCLGGGSEPVRVLQSRLRTLGYDPGSADGRYGLQTEQAVARFQATHGLAASGTTGVRTWRAIEAAARIAAEQRAAAQKAAAQKAAAQRAAAARRERARASMPQPRTRKGARTRRHPPAVPVTAVVSGWVAIGLAAAMIGYGRTRRRLARRPPVPGRSLVSATHDRARR